MSLRLIIFGTVLSTLVNAGAQNVLGLTKEEVKAVIKSEYQDFSLDHTIVKQQFNYLKFVNGSSTKTFIVYFDVEDIAKSAKMVCDYAEYDFVRDDLNAQYKKTGDNEWVYPLERRNIAVVLTEQDWYFTVRFSPGE
jgi:hypothetical protein